MARVIQDSDDEGGYSPSPSPTKIQGAVALLPDANGSSNRSDSTGKISLLFTRISSDLNVPGVLQRRIQDAHRDLLSLSRSNESSAGNVERHQTSPVPPNIIRMTDDHSSSSLLSSSSKKLDRRQTFRIYGRSNQGTHDSISASEALFDIMKQDSPSIRRSSAPANPDNDSPSVAHETLLSAPPDVAGSLSAEQWTLPGSMRDLLAEHEPITMFPEGSSTVPDSSSTRQRLLDDAIAARQEYQAAVTQIGGCPRTDSPSIPWSTFIQTPSVCRNISISVLLQADQVQIGSDSEQRKAGQESDHATPLIALPEASRVLKSPEAVSILSTAVFDLPTFEGRPAKRIKRSKTMAGSISQSDVGCAVDELSSHAEISVLKADKPTVESRRDSSFESQRNRKVKVNKLNRKDDSNADELNSDELDTGLPKERYQPRPSRSRSTIIVSRDIDYSVRPEKAAKARKLRGNTTSEVEVSDGMSHSDVTWSPVKTGRITRAKVKRHKTADATLSPRATPGSEELKVILEMGFSPTRAKIALQDQSGDLDKAVEALVNTAQDSVFEKTVPAEPKLSVPERATLQSGGIIEELSMSIKPGHSSESANSELQMSNSSKSCADALVSVEIPLSKADLAKAELQGHDVEKSNASSSGRGRDEDRLSEKIRPSSQDPQEHKATHEGGKKVLSSRKRKKSIPGGLHDDDLEATEEENPQTTKRRRRSTQETAEGAVNTTLTNTTLATEKKGRRGRPRSDRKLHDEEVKERYDGSDVGRTHESTLRQKAHGRQPLGDLHTNSTRISDITDVSAYLHSTNTPPPAERNESASSTKGSPCAPTNIPETVVPRPSPNRHSPLNKSRVSYRVGLSRQVRIAPLLRVMKK